jgi:O-antigen ligase
VTPGAILAAAGPAARRAGWARPVIVALASVSAGLALGLALYRFPPPLALAVAAGASAVGVLALSVVRYHAAAALGVLLLGVVVIEPAPSDGVLLVVIAVAIATGRFSLHDVPAPVLALLAAYAALNLASAVQVGDPERAAAFFGITLYLMVLALWLPGFLTSAGRARLLVGAYVAAAVTSAALGVLALLTPLPGAELLAEGGRARALFQDPNVFGPFLVPAALILVDEILQPRLLSVRLPMKALMLGVLTLGVLFSYSRGAWLNLVVGLVVMGVALSLRRGAARRAVAFFALSLAVASITVAVVATTGSADFLAERARSQSYDVERFSAQRAALRPAERYPFGAGPGQFESVAGISAHSIYARALGEQGFPGLLVLLALLALTLSFALGNAARGRSTHGIGSAALLAAWCGLLANSAFVDTLHWRHLWLVAALIWAGTMLRRGDQSSGGTRVARRGVHAGSE